MHAAGGGLTCPASHAVRHEDHILVFGTPAIGKYDPAYAAKYAALWAFGFETRHSGLDEGLYRTAASFVGEALSARPRPSPLIVDAGCGVGRVLVDCSRLAPNAAVLGFDASPAMLSMVRAIVLGDEPVSVNLAAQGFPALSIAGRRATNVWLARADVEDLPLVDDCADIVLSVNIVDRAPQGPEAVFRECHRILAPGGTFAFFDPFNWIQARFWERYADCSAILHSLESLGFSIETWLDDLFYREILDGRGSFQEFRTMAVKATKK